MLPKSNNFYPPKPGTPIPYICQDCSEKFTVKKSRFPFQKHVKCPKCGSIKCLCPVRF